MEKKGELTTQQIVTLIILIVSFIVIIIFIFFLNPKDLTDSQICHNSVVLQGKASGLVGGVDCKTSYYCISSGDECVDDSEKISVNAENKEEIFKALADKMSECWWMFGEGKINYAGGSSLKCGICSIISFDEKIKAKYPQISYSEFYSFLETAKKDETQTYLRYLHGVFSVRDIDFSGGFNETDLRGILNTNQKYSIITGYDYNFVESNDVLKVTLIPTSETSKTGCKEFLTIA